MGDYSKSFYIVENIKYSSRIGELKCYKIQLVPFQSRKDKLQLTYTMVEDRNPPGGFVNGDGNIYDIKKDKAVLISNRLLAEVFELENEEAFIADIL